MPLKTQAAIANSLRKALNGKLAGFADYKVALVTGGRGGDGAISFTKAPLQSQSLGPPSGGNGGRAGDVYITASKNFQSLNIIQDSYVVENGGNGMGKNMHGADGPNLEIKVPVGTLVKQLSPPISEWQDDFLPPEASEELYLEGGEIMQELLRHFKFRKGYLPQEDRIRMLKERIPYVSKRLVPQLEIDFLKHGQRHLIRRGGRGGFGNPHFKTPLIPGPGIASRGQRLPPLLLEFQLKTIADAGLVGLPNAGKSTLLKAISNAHPKIAPYPFTTLNPYVGMIEFKDYWAMSVADMPGIIPGAHLNLGLGLRFLQHIERTKIFVYVIDLAGPDPLQDLHDLQHELDSYKAGMSSSRPSIVCANKADISLTSKENLLALRKGTDLPIVPVSAKYEGNVGRLTEIMRSLVEKARKEEEAARGGDTDVGDSQVRLDEEEEGEVK